MSSASSRPDAWRQPVACANAASVEAWDEAWDLLLHFRGDPLAHLAEANEADQAFALGSVFCATYKVLGGAPPTDRSLQEEVARARERSAASERERRHWDGLQLMLAGEFSAAAAAWDEVAAGSNDLAAVRFAHDVYLHVGDAEARLRSSRAAMQRWTKADPGHNFVLSQYSFALEEAGHFGQAEEVGWEALDADPDDLWALHALAHVYESTNNRAAGLDLLKSRQDRWQTQDLLAVHMWWHLGLRLMVEGAFDEVLGIYDQLVPDASTAFRMGDLSSLLWRLELAGVDVGDRWEPLAALWAKRPERHTVAFLDLHAAFAFARSPKEPQAAVFFAGAAKAGQGDTSENAETLRVVARPAAQAMERFASADYQAAVDLLDEVEPPGHRLGGSVAQREILQLTRAAASERLAANGGAS